MKVGLRVPQGVAWMGRIGYYVGRPGVARACSQTTGGLGWEMRPGRAAARPGRGTSGHGGIRTRTGTAFKAWPTGLAIRRVYRFRHVPSRDLWRGPPPVAAAGGPLPKKEPIPGAGGRLKTLVDCLVAGC